MDATKGIRTGMWLLLCLGTIHEGLAQNVYGPPPGAAIGNMGPQGPQGTPGGPPSMGPGHPSMNPSQQQYTYTPQRPRPGPMAPSQIPPQPAPAQNNFQNNFRSFGGFSAQLPASMQPQKPKPAPRPLGTYAQFSPPARAAPPPNPQLQAPVGAMNAPQPTPVAQGAHSPEAYSAMLTNFRANMKNVLKRLKDRQMHRPMNTITSGANRNMMQQQQQAPNSVYNNNKQWRQPPQQQSWQQQPPQEPQQQSWMQPQQPAQQQAWQQPQQQPPQPSWQRPPQNIPPQQPRYQQQPQQIPQQPPKLMPQPQPQSSSPNKLMQMLLAFQKMRAGTMNLPQSPAPNAWNQPRQPQPPQNTYFQNPAPTSIPQQPPQPNFFQNRPQQQFPQLQNTFPRAAPTPFGQPIRPPVQQQPKSLATTSWHSPRQYNAPWQQPQQPQRVYLGNSNLWVRPHKPAPKYGLEPTPWNTNNQGFSNGQKTLGIPPPARMGGAPPARSGWGNGIWSQPAAQPTMGNPFKAAPALAAGGGNATSTLGPEVTTVEGATPATGATTPSQGGMGGLGNPFSGVTNRPGGPALPSNGIMTSMGWLPNPFNEGKASECPKKVTPGRLCCDGFWNMVPPPPDQGHYLCCDKGLYNLKTQICVNGFPMPRPPKSGYKMGCGNAMWVLYDPLTSLCCDDFVTPNPNNTLQCCRKHPFNPKTHLCCGESTKPRPTDPAMKMMDCCGKNMYNPTTHMCCGDNAFPKQPGMQCCGKRFIIKGQGSCCWGEPIPMGGMCMR